MITDDKGAAGRIDTLFKKTDGQFRGKKIVIFSTPKLAQILYNEAIITDKVQIKAIIPQLRGACGTDCKTKWDKYNILINDSS